MTVTGRRPKGYALCPPVERNCGAGLLEHPCDTGLALKARNAACVIFATDRQGAHVDYLVGAIRTIRRAIIATITAS